MGFSSTSFSQSSFSPAAFLIVEPQPVFASFSDGSFSTDSFSVNAFAFGTAPPPPQPPDEGTGDGTGHKRRGQGGGAISGDIRRALLAANARIQALKRKQEEISDDLHKKVIGQRLKPAEFPMLEKIEAKRVARLEAEIAETIVKQEAIRHKIEQEQMRVAKLRRQIDDEDELILSLFI